jgi:hypothetical protein
MIRMGRIILMSVALDSLGLPWVGPLVTLTGNIYAHICVVKFTGVNHE